MQFRKLVRLKRIGLKSFLLFFSLLFLVTFYSILSRLNLDKITVSPSCIQGEAVLHCYEQYYRNLVAEKKTTFAFADLKARAVENSQINESYCHQITHTMGRAAVLAYGTFSEASKFADSIAFDFRLVCKSFNLSSALINFESN